MTDSWVSLGEIRRNREGDQLVLEGEARVTILYLDENDALQALQRPLTVSCRLDAPEGPVLLPDGLLRGGVRRPLRRGGSRCASRWTSNSSSSGSSTPRRCAGPPWGSPGPGARGISPRWCSGWPPQGEGLWELAKAYGTTTEQIVQANGLEEGQLPLGRMLLIPSVR